MTTEQLITKVSGLNGMIDPSLPIEDAIIDAVTSALAVTALMIRNKHVAVPGNITITVTRNGVDMQATCELTPLEVQP